MNRHEVRELVAMFAAAYTASPRVTAEGALDVLAGWLERRDYTLARLAICDVIEANRQCPPVAAIVEAFEAPGPGGAPARA